MDNVCYGVGVIMRRIVVGMSGASGMPLAVKVLTELRKHDIEIHLVYTKGAEMTIAQECSCSLEDIKALADVVYDNQNIGASIASGTYECEGMLIIPCSMKTVAGIAHGFSEHLLLRAADVMIKERRCLVLGVRETPFSCIHLDNMSYLSKLPQVCIMPLVMSYYHHPESLQDMEAQLVGKLLSPFHIEVEGYQRWK